LFLNNAIPKEAINIDKIKYLFIFVSLENIYFNPWANTGNKNKIIKKLNFIGLLKEEKNGIT
jgi:hypothetical protein